MIRFNAVASCAAAIAHLGSAATYDGVRPASPRWPIRRPFPPSCKAGRSSLRACVWTARCGVCHWVGRRTGWAAKLKAIEEQIAEEARFKRRATMAMATVTALRDTGTTINDNPEAAITVTYTRADGMTAHRTRK